MTCKPEINLLPSLKTTACTFNMSMAKLPNVCEISITNTDHSIFLLANLQCGPTADRAFESAVVV